MTDNSELQKLLTAVYENQLSPPDHARLNALLKHDPIAQEEYLDHMYLIGLLERELGSVARANGSKPLCLNHEPRSWRPKRRAVLAAAVVVLSAILWQVVAIRDKTEEPDLVINLENGGFETWTDVAFAEPPSGWHGDTVEVVNEWKGVSPPEGQQMLRFIRSTAYPADSCEIYQAIDLRNWNAQSPGEPQAIDASVDFNSQEVDSLNPYVFGITLYSFATNPSLDGTNWPLHGNSAMNYMERREVADADPDSWQQLNSKLLLSADTNFVVLQISVRHGSEDWDRELPGQLVDNVQVKIHKL